MNIPEHTFLEILQDNIQIDDETVPVIVKNRLEDSTPCITINTIKSDYLDDKKIYTSYYPLKKDHPLYDNDNPNKKYPQEMVEQSKLVSLQINLWCNTERQRYIINQKILELLNKAFNYHYSTCDNYNQNSKECGTLKRECLSIKDLSSRGIKGLCLKPKIYGYKSIFKKNNIRKINLDTEFNQDELDKNPPILHTIYRINLEYLDKYNRGGNPSLKFELKL
ncbi:MAG: hypothetical protein K1X33_05055 [Methanobacteriaceae archaeon]|nr:hypothetical protein [Methanobacteriaceae archaeon]